MANLNDSANGRAPNLEQFLCLFSEMEDLFSFVSPEQLRKNLQWIFFTFLDGNPDGTLNDHRELFRQVHYLLNFLEEAESILKPDK